MDTRTTVILERRSQGRYVIRNANGYSVTVGAGEGALSPVELLLGALAACSSVDVDTVVSRRGAPESFQVRASALERVDHLLEDLTVEVDIVHSGALSPALVSRAMAISHESTCTVSRTLESAQEVTARASLSGERVYSSDGESPPAAF